MVNALGVNDDWQFSVNYPLMRLVDKAQKQPMIAPGKDRQMNYQAQLVFPIGRYKASFSHGYHQYKQYVAGFHQPLLYHGQSKNMQLSLNGLIHRDGRYKIEGYLKGYHKQASHFIDDIEIEVQNRRTSGYHLGINHQHQLENQGHIYLNIDYRRGTAARHAKSAPEENIYDIFGNKLPAEGYSRAPIWLWYINYTSPIQTPNHHLVYNAKLQGQYANKLPLSSELYYIGGRYSVRGFKDGATLSGEHGLTLGQEISYQIPYTANNQYSQLYLGLDQGWVRGAHTTINQRYLLGTTLGIRHQYQNLGIDVFIGRGIKAPRFISREMVIGGKIDYNF